MDLVMVTLLVATAAEAIGCHVWLATTIPFTGLVLLFSVFNGLLYHLYSILIYPDFVSPFKDLPCPPGGRTILGHVLATVEKPVGIRLRIWNETIPNDGILRVRELFGADGLMITSPNLLKEILVDNTYDYVKSPPVRRVLHLILGNGVINVEGDEHRFQRKRLLPSFGLGPIKDLYPLFWEKSTELACKLSEQPGPTEVTLSEWCSRATLDIIGLAALGKDFGTVQDPDNELVRQYVALTHPDSQKVLWFLLNFILPSWLLSRIPFWHVPTLIERTSKSLHAYAHTLVNERQTALLSGLSLESQAEKMQLRRPDILSSLVQANELSAPQLADQVLTMMAAGHETTSSTLAFVSVLLATHPDTQSALRAEIRANTPSPASDETVSAAQLDKLPLLAAVCAETLRMFPTVPFSARTVATPTRLGGRLVPPGTEIWLPIWAVNRATALWGPDADEFRPERWITDGAFNNNGGAASNFATMTFSQGPRSCLGMGFAKAELRCLVAALVGRFQLELTQPLEKYVSVGMITTKPQNETPMKLTRIEGW